MVFITGATGFLGSYLVKGLIRKGDKVRALKRSTSRFELLGDYANDVEWIEGDMLDVVVMEDALDGIEKVYHCAGVVSTGGAKDRAAMAANIDGTANLFNAALNSKVKKVVHVSSATALGLPLGNQLVDENYYSGADKLMFDYFKSKRQGELEAWRAHAEGLDVVIVNPAAIIGAGYWTHEPMKVFPAVHSGLSFYTSGTNGFMDVRDVSDVMIQLMESNISGERYLLIAENASLKEFICLVADALNVKRPVFRLNRVLEELAWRYEAVASTILRSEPRFTKNDIRIAGIHFAYDNAKVVKMAGGKFRTLKQSVDETAQCFLESKSKGMNYATFDSNA